MVLKLKVAFLCVPGNHLVDSGGVFFNGHANLDIKNPLEGLFGHSDKKASEAGVNLHAGISSDNGIKWQGNGSVGVNSTAGQNRIEKLIQILETVLRLASNNKNASSAFANEAVETLGGALGAALDLSRLVGNGTENNVENTLNAIIIIMNGAIRGGLKGQMTDQEINRLIEEIDKEIREAASKIKTAQGNGAFQLILNGVLGSINARLSTVIGGLRGNGDGFIFLIRSLAKGGLQFINTGNGNILEAIKFVIIQSSQAVQRALLIPQSVFKLFISQFIRIIDQLGKTSGNLLNNQIIENRIEELIERLEGVGGTITKDISKLIQSGQSIRDRGRVFITDGIKHLFGLEHLFGSGNEIDFGFNASTDFQILNKFINNLNLDAFKFGGNLVANIVGNINNIVKQGSNNAKQIYNILNDFQRIIEKQEKSGSKSWADFRSTIVGTAYSLITEIYKTIGVDLKIAQSETNQFIGDINRIIDDYLKVGLLTNENLEEIIGKIRERINDLAHLPLYLRNLISEIISGEIRIYFNIAILANHHNITINTSDDILTDEEIEKVAVSIIDILKKTSQEIGISKDELELKLKEKLKATGHLGISISLTGVRKVLEDAQTKRQITKKQLDQIWKQLVDYVQKNRISLKNLDYYIDQLTSYAFEGLKGKIDASVVIELKAQIKYYITLNIFTNINNEGNHSTKDGEVGTSTKSGEIKNGGKITISENQTTRKETINNELTEKSVSTPLEDQTTVEKHIEIKGAKTPDIKITTPFEDQVAKGTSEKKETETTSNGETTNENTGKEETETTITTLKGDTIKESTREGGTETSGITNSKPIEGETTDKNKDTIDIKDFEKQVGINFTQNSALKIYFNLGIDFSRIFILSLNGQQNGSTNVNIQIITNKIKATIYLYKLKFTKFNRNEFKVFINAFIWSVVSQLNISSAKTESKITQLTKQINALVDSYGELSISDLIQLNRDLEKLVRVSFSELSESQRAMLKFILNVSLSMIVQEKAYGSFNYNSTTGQISINSKSIINIIEQLLPKNYFHNFGIDSFTDFINIIQNGLSKKKFTPISKDNLLKQIEFKFRSGLNISEADRNAVLTTIKHLVDSRFQSGIRTLEELSEFLSAANKIILERLRGRIDQAILNQFILQLDISVTLQFTFIQIETTKTSNNLIKNLIKGGINRITNGVNDINSLVSNTLLNGINNFKLFSDFGFNSADNSVKFGSNTVNNTVNFIFNKILDNL